MFTGIIEAMGNVISMEENGTNRTYWINSPISKELKIDQSISHNGVCLTVEEVMPEAYRVTAIQETLSKTNMYSWKVADLVNLERCLSFNGRLDGHIVQGHVDSTAMAVEVNDLNGSWLYTFAYPPEFKELVIEKGSICLNGISLTIFDVTDSRFSVAIIPYTYEHTNLQSVKTGDYVNLEFDMLGKYVNRIMQFKK